MCCSRQSQGTCHRIWRSRKRWNQTLLCAFAASFARSVEEKEHKASAQQRAKPPQQTEAQTSGSKNPHFSRQNKQQGQSGQRNAEQQTRASAPEPMEVDPSLSRFRRPTQASAGISKPYRTISAISH